MKKLMGSIFIGLTALTSFAALQFDLVSSRNPAQPWPAANFITVNVTEGGSLWMSGYVSNWYSVIDLKQTANVSAGNYGWIDADGNRNASTGETTQLTFSDGNKSVSTTGYYLGDFAAGDQIGIWLTTTGGAEGSSLESLGGDLLSRQMSTKDLDGNTRLNFGFKDGTVEFILSGGEFAQPTGQPLPGLYTVCGIAAACLAMRSRLRKKC